jgi:hypothetical protein
MIFRYVTKKNGSFVEFQFAHINVGNLKDVMASTDIIQNNPPTKSCGHGPRMKSGNGQGNQNMETHQFHGLA